MYILSCVFGKQGYLLNDLVAYNWAKFQHPTTLKRDISHFEFHAYRVIITGASGLELFVDGV